MASLFAGIWQRRDADFETEFFPYAVVAEQRRKREHVAAIKIQTTWRRHIMRRWRKYLGAKATLIQKTFRGHIGRKRIKAALEAHCQQVCQAWYDGMATRIQKAWRGHWSRKTRCNYYRRKQYLAAVAIKSDAIRAELDEVAEAQRAQHVRKARRALATERETVASRVHHLLGTRNVPGVLAPHRERPASPAHRHVSFYNHRPLSPRVLPNLPKRRNSEAPDTAMAGGAYDRASPQRTRMTEAERILAALAAQDTVAMDFASMQSVAAGSVGSQLDLGRARSPGWTSKQMAESAALLGGAADAAPAGYLGRSDDILYARGLLQTDDSQAAAGAAPGGGGGGGASPSKRGGKVLALGAREERLLAAAEAALATDRDAWRSWMREQTVRDACRPLIYRRHMVPQHLRDRTVVREPAPPETVERRAPRHWRRADAQAVPAAGNGAGAGPRD